MIQVGLPVLLLVIISILLIVFGWAPTNRKTYVGLFIGLIVLLFLSIYLIQSVSAHGWSEESTRGDTLKISEDNMYEYRIDLINLFRRNSHARLYLKSVESGGEKLIPISIDTRKIVGIEMKEINNWVILLPTETSSRYILVTTQELGIPVGRFEIDTNAGTSRKLE